MEFNRRRSARVGPTTSSDCAGHVLHELPLNSLLRADLEDDPCPFPEAAADILATRHDQLLAYCLSAMAILAMQQQRPARAARLEAAATALRAAQGLAVVDRDPAVAYAQRGHRPAGFSRHPLAHEGLSQREMEVAILIARGQTSRQIAESLVISEKTADSHADHIRTKLSLRSRAEIAAWTVASGLYSPLDLQK
jgi:DNA-binding CsgD family transcriptional regulator